VLEIPHLPQPPVLLSEVASLEGSLTSDAFHLDSDFGEPDFFASCSSFRIEEMHCKKSVS